MQMKTIERVVWQKKAIARGTKPENHIHVWRKSAFIQFLTLNQKNFLRRKSKYKINRNQISLTKTLQEN